MLPLVAVVSGLFSLTAPLPGLWNKPGMRPVLEPHCFGQGQSHV